MAANDPIPPDPSPDLVFRRGKLRKRDDPAVDLLREAMANVSETARVKRITLELGRLYDPVRNGPILDPAMRRRVLELLEGGRDEEARRLLDGCLARYLGRGDPDLKNP